MKLNTYLSFNGDCEAAFKFYEQHLGARITTLMTFKDAPADAPISPELHDKVMHAELDIGGDVLMGTDGGCMSEQSYEGIKGAHVVVDVDRPEEAERIYAVLSEGGTVEMAMDETFFAQRFGMVADRFGVPWMVICGTQE